MCSLVRYISVCLSSYREWYFRNAAVLQLSWTDCKLLTCRAASDSCGLPLFSAIVLSYWKLLVSATEDGQDVKESSEMCSLLYTRHFYFYNFVPT